MKNKYLKVFFFGVLFFALLYLSPYFVFMNSKVVCAKVKQEGGTRGMKGLVYFYNYQGKVYKGSFDSSSGISMRLDVYKDNDCFEVEVSTIFPSMSRVKKEI
jgi:hypothetical protein